MTSEIALTHVSTPLAPLVAVLHFIRTHPCSGNIFEVARLLYWMVISSWDWLWSALGLRVLVLRVEDVNLGMRVLVWYHFLFGSTITIHTNSNIKGRRVSSSLPISLVCLHLFFIFCLSPTFSSFFVCLHLNPHFLSVSIFIFIFYLSPSLYGDRQKMRIKMETDRKLR